MFSLTLKKQMAKQEEKAAMPPPSPLKKKTEAVHFNTSSQHSQQHTAKKGERSDICVAHAEKRTSNENGP